MLRDHLVCGIGNDAIQEKLIVETNLTLKKAMEIALGMETAASNASVLNSSPSEVCIMKKYS